MPAANEPVMGCFVKIASGYNVAHIGISLWVLLSTQTELNGPLTNLRDHLKSRLEEWVPKDQVLQILYRP